MALESLS